MGKNEENSTHVLVEMNVQNEKAEFRCPTSFQEPTTAWYLSYFTSPSSENLHKFLHNYESNNF